MELRSGRAPQGARGLKFMYLPRFFTYCCRAPQGARGLKFDVMGTSDTKTRSRPARGAWVEIKVVRMQTLLTPVAPRKGRVG